VASFAADSVGLAAVFGDVGVNEVNNVRTDGSAHDIGNGKSYGGVSGHISFKRMDSDEWTSCGGHCLGL
jgi:hypothetical protein